MENNNIKHELWKIAIAVFFMIAIFLSYYFYVRHKIIKNSMSRADHVLSHTETIINTRISEIENTVRNMQILAEYSLDDPDFMYDVATCLLEDADYIIGGYVSFVSDYYPEKGRLFSAYAGYMRGPDGTVSIHTLRPTHDYTQLEWFREGITAKDGHWSEPYTDNVGEHNIVMTYSRAIMDSSDRVVGAICVDITLDSLSKIIQNINLYPNSYCYLTSAKGVMIVPPPANIEGKRYIYSKHIEDTNWFLTLDISKKALLKGLRVATLTFSILVLCGMIVFFFIIFNFMRNLRRLKSMNDERQQMESELSIARDIQRSLIPEKKTSQDIENLDVCGFLVPAKFVGGDLYDYFVHGHKLIFCIGDVSGKGVPAALLMAIGQSLFRTLSAHNDKPEEIMRSLNESLTSNNPDCMFITLFIGTLDQTTGEMKYCNAGHNPPLWIHSGKAEYLNTTPDLILGVDSNTDYTCHSLQFNAGDSMFLYTDGLTEAENLQKELFGESRTLSVASGLLGLNAEAQIQSMNKAVGEFVDNAEQSDDLTMLVVRYVPDKQTITFANKLDELSRLEPFLSGVLQEKDVDSSLMAQIDLAVEEAVANVLMYAYPEGDEGTVTLGIEVTDDSIRLEISDQGVPFDPLAQEEPDLDASLEDRPIGGLGIHLVREIMDSVTYERRDNNNILTMEKRRC